ncbi:MAG: hypothetical protein ACTSW1_19040 [Candidatus Hodarchaeales archaeon]
MGILYCTIEILADKNKLWGFPHKQFMDFYTKKNHGGQVVSSLEESLKMLDLIDDTCLTYCTCRKSMHDDPEETKDFVISSR